MGQANAEVFLLPRNGCSLSCCALSGGSCARRYMAKISCVENCASYSFARRVRLRPRSRPKLAHATKLCVSLHCSILSWCAAAPVTPPPALPPVNCRLSWGSTLALAVIKRLNNASCLIIIYDTRRCRLLPEKPAGIMEREERGAWHMARLEDALI